MDKDYFRDERLWALSRKRWRIHRLWLRCRFPLFLALIIASWAYLIWLDERDKRAEAESQLTHFITAAAKMGCYGDSNTFRVVKPDKRKAT